MEKLLLCQLLGYQIRKLMQPTVVVVVEDHQVNYHLKTEDHLIHLNHRLKMVEDRPNHLKREEDHLMVDTSQGDRERRTRAD